VEAAAAEAQIELQEAQHKAVILAIQLELFRGLALDQAR